MSIVFRNVRVFDSRKGTIGDAAQVVVRAGIIETVGPAHVSPAAGEGDIVIEGAGRTLIPGLIDAHWHAVFAAAPLTSLLMSDAGFLHVAHIVAAATARDTPMRGFTTVRDAGGPSFALKQAIDAGITQGPRIFPSGAMIS